MSEDGPPATGYFSFRDPDLLDYHVVSSRPFAGGAPGPGSFTFIFDHATDTVNWQLSLDGGAADFLAVDEDMFSTWEVHVVDSHGAELIDPKYRVETHAIIHVLIHGANDAPVPTSPFGDYLGSVIEGAETKASNTFEFKDVDISDIHQVTDIQPVGHTLGSVEITNVQSSDKSEVGFVSWEYRINSDDLEGLAKGEERVEKFLITVDDYHGGSFTKEIEVHLFGTEDDSSGGEPPDVPELPPGYVFGFKVLNGPQYTQIDESSGRWDYRTSYYYTTNLDDAFFSAPGEYFYSDDWSWPEQALIVISDETVTNSSGSSSVEAWDVVGYVAPESAIDIYGATFVDEASDVIDIAMGGSGPGPASSVVGANDYIFV